MNAASAAFESLFEALAADGETAGFVTDDVLAEDRRLGFKSSGRGIKSFLKNMDSVRSVGVRLGSCDVIATRGERHALVHGVFVSDSEFAVDVLARVSCDEDGKISSYAVFDLHDGETARQDLDAQI
jgi:hypothetical protein